MKRSTLGKIVITGVGIAALIPLTAYAGRIVSYVTLQPTSPGTAESGHINVKGYIISGNGFKGDGSGLTSVTASGLALPMTTSSGTSGLTINSTSGPAINTSSLATGWGNATIVGTNNDPNGFAIYGTSPYAGVIGEAQSEGVLGTSSQGVGVVGYGQTMGGYFVTSNSMGKSLYAQNSAGGYAIYASGNTAATGTKSFLIDDPRDPANYTIRHYSQEGPEPLNVYAGTTKTDSQGYATVQLPDYFETINKNPRYQLTVVDTTDSPDFVLTKVVKTETSNQFTIRTSKPNTVVSWRVDAGRNDPWVQRQGTPVVEEKRPEERGKYLEPELYGQPPTAGTDYHPGLARPPKTVAPK